MKQITYAVHRDGFVVSRVGNEVAWPVLDFAAIGMGGLEKSTGKVYEKGNFTGPTNYDLAKFEVNHTGSDWVHLRWTKKVPLAVKNRHREFWGLKPLKPDATWTVYILRCAGGSFYTGVTTDLARRLAEHQAGTGAKYTRSRLPVELATSFKVPSRSDALVAEYEIKQLNRQQKEQFILDSKEKS